MHACGNRVASAPSSSTTPGSSLYCVGELHLDLDKPRGMWVTVSHDFAMPGVGSEYYTVHYEVMRMQARSNAMQHTVEDLGASRASDSVADQIL